MQSDDSFPQHFRRNQHSPQPRERGLDDLVAQWESHVEAVAQGRLGDRDEYLNAMDARRILAERLAAADETQRAAVLPRLEEIDQRLRSLVLSTDVCAWGSLNA